MNARTKQTQGELRIGKNARRIKSSLGGQPLITHEERILERKYRSKQIDIEQLKEKIDQLHDN